MEIENDYDQDGEVENGIPKFTKWEHRFSFFGLHFYYVPSIKKTFINHWEVSQCMPIVVNFIIWSSYFLFLILYVKVLNWSINQLILMTVFLSLYVLSYFGIILEGPGYLPYFYPHRYPSFNTEYPDYLSGIVTNKKQFEFVKKRVNLRDAHYFKSARRVVIRPDHFCDWCACFVGKKNYKLFFLFNFWGIIYIGFFGVSSLMGFIRESAITPPNVFLLVFSMMYVFIAFFFFIFQFIFVMQTLYSIFTDTREFENIKKNGANIANSSHKKKSCLDKLEEVFGSVKLCFLWLLPVGAFHGIDDYLLINTRDTEENEWLL